MQEEAQGSLASVSPSFNSYSSVDLTDIAARVIQELHGEDHHYTLSHSVFSDDNTYNADLYRSTWESDTAGCASQMSHEDNRGDVNGNYDVQATEEYDEDEDFEFALVSGDENSSPISADEIFYNGQIRTVYPIFDRSLLVDYALNDTTRNPEDSDSGGLQLTNETAPRRRRPPLKMLMFEERGAGSCSSSASDPDDAELEGLEPETYCVWNPKSVAARDASSRNKSKSTGTTSSSSKRWKLRDLLLLRSQSDGKNSLVFVSRNDNKKMAAPPGSSVGELNKEAAKQATRGGWSEGIVTKKEVGDEKGKRKTMLPYRTDIVGLFHNMNGVVGRNLHPF